MGGIIQDISVWIVDDHHDFRDTVEELLDSQPDMICTASVASCERLLYQVYSLPKPDVVLMDLNFKSRMSGSEGIRELRKIIPDIKVLVLSMHSDEDLIFDALCSGASGFIQKHDDTERIIEGIRNIVHKRMLYMSSSTANRILHLFSSASTDNQLSETEIQVLECIKERYPTSQISTTLQLDQTEVDASLHAIYQKLHATQATA